MCNMNKILEKAKELVAMLEEKEIKDKVELSTVAPGGVIDLGEDEFVVLGHDEGGTLVISKDFMEEDVKFGDNTDFNGSNVQRVLYEDILPKIEEVVGKDSILSQTVKLTTVDNQDIYKDVAGRIRLLTFDEARKYNPLIVNEELDDYWWLMTPWTSNDRLNYPVAVVSPSGSIHYWDFDNQFGVRPVLYLKSNIFVSLGGKCDEK
ncbi:hypothetical protein HMPREF0988_00874 [Lachnospiraceae bacterium 1_4_56FAA]|nr:hypothetical protein HMPREF0988_00874 [Lachnospiraceae bacterium 1_4_56FAA]